MLRTFSIVIHFCATLALIGVVLGYGGPIFYGLDLLGHFRLHLLIAAIILFLLALSLGRMGAVWRAAAAGVIALAGLSPLWESPVETAGGPALSVLTANLHYGNPRTPEVMATLIKANADILVTNETTKATLDGVNPLSKIYPYRVSLKTRGSILRTVIWSKYPSSDESLFLEDTVGPTGALAIVKLPNGRRVSVLGLHLAHAMPGNQRRQIDALDTITAGVPRPLIVLGDFNAAPWSHALRRVEDLTGTKRVPGYHITWRGDYPSPVGPIPSLMGHAIDHVLLSPGMAAETVNLIPIPGSDHIALGAVVRLPDAWHRGMAAAQTNRRRAATHQ